ncbi:hypothetical protein BWZ20_07580 [Winogradskyella sp. J14-2]|uniref:hypothetical protein n=1 Tax=Winogradskyella sp. J14-2 TaxID=1936080 RepID=UPI000972A0FF|nr:hypothetical protein [Winogradskyella sp. J14-2]APY08168.1 hypothetical protein BWZ20_07580 [Winogradskyella sp. J14-2]
MKALNYLYILLAILATSCGSYEKVIANDGTVYEVKGNKIKLNGEEVTENLSYKEQAEIKQLLADKIEERKAAEKKQKELENQKERQEEIEREAKEKQEALEEKKEALEDKLKAKKEARENYIELKRKYDKELRSFKKLKRKGELSPNDIKDWEAKLSDLKTKTTSARAELKKFD